MPCCRACSSFPIRAHRRPSGSPATSPPASFPHGHRCLVSIKPVVRPPFLQIKSISTPCLPSPSSLVGGGLASLSPSP
ncbi:Nucleoid-associated protein chloroplastic [Zea mays]|uniref:Nucleoid-associated protein chloroplastic n=1 Tax=Zea mays TaxID=4577 RepID=A0A1D6QRY6_MAIZE|nr:Nucleoid-associated protein chloroplastic [Zea mays]